MFLGFFTVELGRCRKWQKGLEEREGDYVGKIVHSVSKRIIFLSWFYCSSSLWCWMSHFKQPFADDYLRSPQFSDQQSKLYLRNLEHSGVTSQIGVLGKPWGSARGVLEIAGPGGVDSMNSERVGDWGMVGKQLYPARNFWTMLAELTMHTPRGLAVALKTTQPGIVFGVPGMAPLLSCGLC